MHNSLLLVHQPSLQDCLKVKVFHLIINNRLQRRFTYKPRDSKFTMEAVTSYEQFREELLTADPTKYSNLKRLIQSVCTHRLMHRCILFVALYFKVAFCAWQIYTLHKYNFLTNNFCNPYTFSHLTMHEP